MFSQLSVGSYKEAFDCKQVRNWENKEEGGILRMWLFGECLGNEHRGGCSFIGWMRFQQEPSKYKRKEKKKTRREDKKNIQAPAVSHTPKIIMWMEVILF